MAGNNLISDIRAMSDKELVVFKNELLMEESKINEAYADEIAGIATVNFDPNSYWGEKKINKIAKKYAEQSSGIDYLLELVVSELSRRDLVNDISGTRDSEQGVDEFLESEEIKTMAYRSEIEDE